MTNKSLILSLTKTFSSTFNLYYLTHACHWNVEGINFYEVHILLDGQYKNIQEAIDDTAEKIRQLDAYAPTTLEFISNTGIKFEDCSKYSVPEMTKSLVAAHTIFIGQLNETIKEAKKIGREDLVNYLGGRWEEHGKMRWMLRATAKKYQGVPEVINQSGKD